MKRLPCISTLGPFAPTWFLSSLFLFWFYFVRGRMCMASNRNTQVYRALLLPIRPLLVEGWESCQLHRCLSPWAGGGELGYVLARPLCYYCFFPLCLLELRGGGGIKEQCLHWHVMTGCTWICHSEHHCLVSGCCLAMDYQYVCCAICAL